MHTYRDVINAGDVVARHGRFFVVARVQRDRLTLLPLLRPGGSRHRADVWPLDAEEMAPTGLPGCDFIVSCRLQLVAARRGLVRVGSLPASMLARVELAVVRERADSVLEASGSFGSTLLAQTTSSGRRVGPARSS